MSNKVPNGWKQCKLGEVATIKTGQTNSVDAVADGVYPLFDRSKDVKRSSKYLFDCEAVIVPGEGKDFVPRYYKGKFDLHQRAYAVIPNEQVCDGRYCYYALLDGRSYFSLVAVGSTVMSLRLSTFESFDILLPPLPEQRAIASVLSNLDDKIDLLHRENKTLEAMAEALFRQWFIEEAKDEWEEVSLGDSSLATIIKSGINRFEGEKIYLETSDVDNTNVKEGVPITFGNRPSRANMEPVVYSVWFAKKGGVRKLLMFDDYSQGLNKLVLSTGFTGLKTTELSHYYIWCYIMSSEFQEIKDSFVSGSVQPDINNDGVKQIMIPNPDNETLLKFNSIVKELFSKISFNQQQIHTLEKLRDTLLPKLMSGEVRVKYEEEGVASCRA